MASEMLTILISSVSSVALSGAALWLARNWISARLKASIDHEYNQRLEQYKHQLKLSSESEIEMLKAKLSVTASEHSVRFSRLHEQRAEVIAGVYARLVTLRRLLKEYTKSVPPSDYPEREQLRGKIWGAFSDLREFHTTKRIFLPQDVAKAVYDLDVKYVRVFNRFATRVEFNEDADAQINNLKALNEEIDGQVEETLQQLESKFRGLLGDSAHDC